MRTFLNQILLLFGAAALANAKRLVGDAESPLLNFAQPEQIHLSWTGNSNALKPLIEFDFQLLRFS